MSFPNCQPVIIMHPHGCIKCELHDFLIFLPEERANHEVTTPTFSIKCILQVYYKEQNHHHYGLRNSVNFWGETQADGGGGIQRKLKLRKGERN